MRPTRQSAGRRYRYYVCRTARKKGWDACPTKAVAASLIEESVLAQVRDNVPGAVEDEQVSVRAIVQRIVYDGATGKVDLALGVRP